MSIKLVDFYQASKLPIRTYEGEAVNGDYVIENSDKIVTSFEVDTNYYIICNIEEEEK